MKRTFLLCLLSLVISATPTLAAPYFYDTFSDTSKLSPSTTVHWDAKNELLRLPYRPKPNGLALRENGDFLVVEQGGISWYSFDSATGTMQKVNELSLDYTDPLGVTVKQKSKAYWVFDGTSIKRYDYTGTGMAYNPALSIAGLNGIVSVSAAEDSETLSVLTKDGKVTLYSFDGTTMLPLYSFSTGISDPVSVAMVPDGSAFIVAGKTEIGYYQFDPASGSYIRDPILSLAGLNDVIIVDDQNGADVKILKGDKVEHYVFDGSQLLSAPMLGIQPLPTYAIAMSASPKGYDFAYLDDEGTVRYYSFDGNQMVENTLLTVTGLDVLGGYLKPRIYQSVLITPPEPMNSAKITVTENNDPTGTISYEISSDGGATWQSITPGIWTMVPLGSQFVIRGTFDAVNPKDTPRLLDIGLELTRMELKNVRVTHILYPGDNQLDPFPDYTFPVYVRAGSEFTFKVDSNGYIDRVEAVFTNGDRVEMTPEQPVTSETNTWVGRYLPGISTPNGTAEGVTFIGYRGNDTVTLGIAVFYQIDGDVSTSVLVKLTE